MSIDGPAMRAAEERAVAEAQRHPPMRNTIGRPGVIARMDRGG
jgi:hypothetical protein